MSQTKNFGEVVWMKIWIIFFKYENNTHAILIYYKQIPCINQAR